MRKWLNEEFINNAFDFTEQVAICRTTVKAEKNPYYDTAPGKDTEDRVFLLSVSEQEKYNRFVGESVCLPTELAKNNGVWIDEEFGACWWWLRTPGNRSNYAADVNIDGVVDIDGYFVNSVNLAVRPALWVNEILIL